MLMSACINGCGFGFTSERQREKLASILMCLGGLPLALQCDTTRYQLCGRIFCGGWDGRRITYSMI